MKRKTWIKVGSWVLIILIAPFAIEIAFVAEVVGVDIAVAMLVLYLSAIRNAFWQRVETTVALLSAALATPADRFEFVTRSYVWNVAATGVIVWITGSVMLSLILWLPTILVATQYS